MEKNMGLKMKEKMVKAKMTKINMEMSPQRNPIIMVKELEMMKIQTTILKKKNRNKNDSIPICCFI